MHVKPIPEGYHSVTPYLIVHDAAAAIDFYKRAFGAIERMRLPMPGNRLGHAEVQIDDSVVMLADEHPEMGVKSAKTIGGSPVSLLIYVENVDEAFPKALAAGGREVRPLATQFYGDRSGVLVDPFGIQWTIASHVENVSLEEVQNRMKAMMKGTPQA
jgi:PhnB protein